MCSLGVSVDIVKSAAENARFVIAQVNPNMPRTLGDSFLHVNDIDVLVPFDEPMIEVPVAGARRGQRAQIGENVAALVEDGSTIEFGIGAHPAGACCSSSRTRRTSASTPRCSPTGSST